MGIYSYTAMDARGHRVRGVVDADTSRLARESLRSQGLTPLEIAVFDAGSKGPRLVGRARTRRSDLQLFYRIIGALLDAGLELSEALESASRQAGARARPLYLNVRSEVASGKSLAEAMAIAVPDMPSMALAAVTAGERSGRTAHVLTALADHDEQRARMRARVLTALLYPALLGAVAVAVSLGLVTYVVPEVVRVFEGYQQQLPWLTRMLISVSGVVHEWGWIMVLIAAGLLVAVPAVARMPAIRLALDRLTLATPGVAAMHRAIQREQFLASLGMLLDGAVPLVDALEAAAEVLTSPQLRVLALGVARDVERGMPVDTAFEKAGLLPPVAMQLVAAGVEGSRLEAMLMRAAALDRDQIQTRIALFLGLLEPLLILLMGAFVLLIVVAILLPVFELNRLVA